MTMKLFSLYFAIIIKGVHCGFLEFIFNHTGKIEKQCVPFCILLYPSEISCFKMFIKLLGGVNYN